ncbi:MAG: hypothetical protein NVS2B16_30580 [Chloroflexota bacterium]
MGSPEIADFGNLRATGHASGPITAGFFISTLGWPSPVLAIALGMAAAPLPRSRGSVSFSLPWLMDASYS